ncbi:MAG: hypothetical protein AMXMBFR67_27790 [Nitrospira sp.]
MVQAVVEGLHTDPIADQPQLPTTSIPQGDGKHAAKFIKAADAPGFEGVEDDFGVGMVGPPPMAAQRFQFSPDRRMVVDFAVERDP